MNLKKRPIGNLTVMIDDLCLHLSKESPQEKWFSVYGVNVPGLNTQGRTIEECIHMARDAAELLAECQTEREAEKRKAAIKSRRKPAKAAS
jgi:predicted RNase H-like HicB family nuclease